ncbi:MAG: TIGR00730 family Rossman fold protein [Anaerolineales bacterium]|nr:TIGR00730 family Rossman fold protein [Anaerolineales bacterium]
MKTICVYCGCSDKLSNDYLMAARKMGRAIARRGLTLAYGAGSTGMMGELADGALEAGGEVVGIIPQVFATPQLMHNGLTRLQIVDTMHRRKAMLLDMADAFVALPGGYGTLEEFFEMLTWAQIGLHSKPAGLLNTLGYFNPLLAVVEHALKEGFIYAEHKALFACKEDPDELLDAVEQYQPPAGLERWVTREDVS